MKELEERIRLQGTVKPGNVLKVDAFLNHQCDVELFDRMGAAWAEHFADKTINKILTIEASGNHDDATRTRAQDTFQEVIEDFHEDDLSDLVVDQQPTEDVSPIGSEASPYIAASSTGNMFFFAPNAGHCQASFACPTSYENALNTFLNRCIG